MNPESLPEAAFAQPNGQNRTTVEAMVQQYVALVVDFLCGPTPIPLPNGWLAEDMADLPSQPVPNELLLERLQTVLEMGMNPGNPAYIGHMDPPPALITVLGEFAAAAANNNMLSRELSPALTQLEVDLTERIARRFGLGDRSGGVLTSGGTLANLQALAVARNRAFDVQRKGLAGLSGRPVFFASESAHISLQKAAMLLGLGTDAVIGVRTDEQDRMDPKALDLAIRTAREAGDLPFAVVATAGTTITGSIDPLPQIGEVARRHGLWYHVDAAFAGALIFSPEHHHRIQGIETADSVTFNPQKWLYVAKTCAMVLFRELAEVKQNFMFAAPYMHPDSTSRYVNLGERGIQGTRHADVLKLWLGLQHFGTDGYAELIAGSYARTWNFVARLRERPDFELATDPETCVVCFRHLRPGGDAAEQDSWTLGLKLFLWGEHALFVSLPLFRGSRWLRVVLLNPLQGDAEIDRLMAGVDAFVAEDEDRLRQSSE